MFHDQGRRFSRTAIHPVDGRENPSPIESLPPPVYEVRKVHRRGSSIPVRCPSSAPLADDDAEYLSKLYDLKTWDMYKRITESRRNRRVIYHPTIEEKPVIDEQDIPEEEEEDLSLESNMIFSFDFDWLFCFIQKRLATVLSDVLMENLPLWYQFAAMNTYNNR